MSRALKDNISERPMRFLVGMPSADSRGGPINCEPPFVAALRATGIEVDEEIYVYGDAGTDVNANTRVRRVIDAARRLRLRIRKNHYDLVHLNTSFDERCLIRDLVVLQAIGKGVPVFLKMHGSIAAFLETKNPVWIGMRRRLFRRADWIGVLSSEERTNFINAGCDPSKLFIVKNAIAPGDAARPGESFKSEQGVPPDVPIILFSSRFIPAKGLIDLVNACRMLKDRGRNIVLMAIGDGPQRLEAETLSRSLGLEKHIRFPGYISEAEASMYHANADIFVLPSYHDEGLPVVLLKCLAAGLPIITTRIRAAADYMSEPDNCLWIDAKSPSDIAAKIESLVDDPARCLEMSANNRRLALEFAPEKVADEYSNLYRSIIDNRERRAAV